VPRGRGMLPRLRTGFVFALMLLAFSGAFFFDDSQGIGAAGAAITAAVIALAAGLLGRAFSALFLDRD
jgi:hypothetical protein